MATKLTAHIPKLVALILFFGKSYAPVLVLSLLLKSTLWRPVRLLLVLFGEPLLRKLFGSIAYRLTKAADETITK
ncbi:hypothetical protein [Budvicia diplopodorum]|uniref:hypothetical protein n=1 Tax=Budvicia diplopodorum TaxID=1119056 RepID=UPI001357755E|nr:hypothetical protein [Budvicia diplopodorum]